MSLTPKMSRNADRLARALNRASRGLGDDEDDPITRGSSRDVELQRRLIRILKHGEKIGWVTMGSVEIVKTVAESVDGAVEMACRMHGEMKKPRSDA